MDSESWSILFSVIGLLLGFISAYGQIKGFFFRLLRFSGESITRWSKNRKETVTALATYPSALVAYLARSFMFILATTLGMFVLTTLLRSTGTAPEWLFKVINLSGGAIIGATLGSLHSTIIDVSKHALELAKSANRDT